MAIGSDLILKEPLTSVVTDGKELRITDATDCEYVFENTGNGYELVQKIFQSKLNRKRNGKKRIA